MQKETTEGLSMIKWKEIISLGFLNAAVAISWIAYHEYQPVLIEKFEFQGLVTFMIGAKAIILVVTPPLAGLLADYILKTKGKFFTIFTVGIGATAMVFMIVASTIQAGPLSAVKPALPIMIVLWLIAMNLFMSPANSMIDSFAPAKKLPVVVAFLFLVTELIYALEPVIVELVHFFGDTLTFVVGGILIGVSGFIFHHVSSDEVLLRKSEMIEKPATKVQPITYVIIIFTGLLLGLAKALLVEVFSHTMEESFHPFALSGEYIALSLLAFSAIFAFSISGYIAKKVDFSRVLGFATPLLAIGVSIMLFPPNLTIYIIGGFLVAVAFSLLNVIGLPYVFKHMTVRHITYAVGIFIGSSEVFTGLFEYYLSK